jgi:hypothetical protein
MYVKVEIAPGRSELALSVAPTAQYAKDLGLGAATVVVLFTTPRETDAALRLAFRLAISATVGVLLVCPVSRGIRGRLRVSRFLRFARRCADSLSARTMGRLRLVIWPVTTGSAVIDDFTTTRSVVLIQRPWWTVWGQSSPKNLTAGRMSML